MKSVITLASAVGLSIALSGAAHAAMLVSSSTNVGPDNFSAPTTSSGTLVGVSGTVTNQYVSPFSDNTSLYNAVQNGTAEYDFSGSFNRLSFVFGTPDSYNSISFLQNGKVFDTFTIAGTNLTNANNYLVTLGTSQRFDAVQFSSTQAALEFSSVSVSSVPLPASAPMFGAALLGLAGLGYVASRKKSAAAA